MKSLGENIQMRVMMRRLVIAKRCSYPNCNKILRQENKSGLCNHCYHIQYRRDKRNANK